MKQTITRVDNESSAT